MSQKSPRGSRMAIAYKKAGGSRSISATTARVTFQSFAVPLLQSQGHLPPGRQFSRSSAEPAVAAHHHSVNNLGTRNALRGEPTASTGIRRLTRSLCRNSSCDNVVCWKSCQTYTRSCPVVLVILAILFFPSKQEEPALNIFRCCLWLFCRLLLFQLEVSRERY